MMGRVSPPVLDLLPAEACSVGPSAGLPEGPVGGVVVVFGLATFAYAAGDETGRRLAAVQLAATKIAAAVEVASACGVSVATLWRWTAAVSQGGVVGLVRERPGPKGPSKLTGPLTARIVALEATGLTLLQIAAAADVSTATVRVALGRVAPRGQEPTRPVGLVQDGVVDTVDHDESRDVARAGEPVVVAEGAHLPLAGLLLGLPALEMTGLLDVAAETFGPMSNGFYGLRATLMTGVFLALLREPRAEGATRIAPADLGRVLGLDRAPEVKTLRRKLAELAAHGAGAQLQAALGAYHAATRPDATGFLYLDGHVRVYTGTRELPKTHIARMRIAGPATEETWVTDTDGDPVMVITAPPSASLAAELARLLPDLRAMIGPRRPCTVVFDRGGYSPAVFTEILSAGFDLLTYYKGTWTRSPEAAFTTVDFTAPDGRTARYELAERTIDLAVPARPASPTTRAWPASTLTLRLIVRRSPSGHQTPILTNRTDLSAPLVAYRMANRWRQENYFTCAREHFALDALDSYADQPDDLDRMVPNPAKARAHDQVVGVGFRGVGDHPVKVVGLVGVAVQGVQGEVLTGAGEVVLLAPPVRHPVGDQRCGQVGAVGQDRCLVPAGAAPHDQPQRQRARGSARLGGRRGSGLHRCLRPWRVLPGGVHRDPHRRVQPAHLLQGHLDQIGTDRVRHRRLHHPRRGDRPLRTRRTPHRPGGAGPTRDARPGGQTREHVDVAADRAAQPQRAPDTDPDQPHRPVRAAGRLPDGHPVAPGELLQVRP